MTMKILEADKIGSATSPLNLTKMITAYNQYDAEGFIKLQALRLRLRKMN